MSGQEFDEQATQFRVPPAQPTPPSEESTHWAPRPMRSPGNGNPAQDAATGAPAANPDATTRHTHQHQSGDHTQFSPEHARLPRSSSSPGSWVSEATWARQTETPNSIPPVPPPPITQASQVPTFPHSSHALPEDRFVAPPPIRERTRTPIPVRQLISWGLAVVLLAVVTGAVYATFFHRPDEDPNTKVPVSSKASVQVRRGDEVVRMYLRALAAGDVEAALALGPRGGPGSAALLTRGAYQASTRSAPMTEVNVPTADANATDIPASYKLGGEQVTTRFQVRKLDSGSWEMARTTVSFRIHGTNTAAVPLQVNGTTIDWDRPLELLPGRYTLGSGLPLIGYSTSDTLTVLHLGYNDGINDHPVAPELTPAGRTAFIAAVRRSLAECTSRRELAPAGCPQSFESPRAVRPGTVQWKLTGDPLDSAKVGLVGADQSRAESSLTLNYQLSMTFDNGGKLNNSPESGRAVARAVMTVKDAALVKVTWQPIS